MTGGDPGAWTLTDDFCIAYYGLYLAIRGYEAGEEAGVAPDRRAELRETLVAWIAATGDLDRRYPAFSRWAHEVSENADPGAAPDPPG